jgi:hypothetical protein
MIYQPYYCGLIGGRVEYGYCFKEFEDDDVCSVDFDIVIGEFDPKNNQEVDEAHKKLATYEWAARAICAAIPGIAAQE